jgi:hypothetical protein
MIGGRDRFALALRLVPAARGSSDELAISLPSVTNGPADGVPPHLRALKSPATRLHLLRQIAIHPPGPLGLPRHSPQGDGGKEVPATHFGPCTF